MTPLNKILPALLAEVVILLACYNSYLMAKSSWFFAEAERHIIRWESSSEPVSPQDILPGENAINNALSYWPHNPEYLSLSALISLWSDYLEGVPPQEAIELQRNSLLHRPGYGQTWQHFSDFKSRSGHFDEEWVFALDRADALSPPVLHQAY